MGQTLAVPISKPATILEDLPDEILLAIFHRLSINTLGLCMCVKKHWLSLLKSPHFISSYKDGRYVISHKDYRELLLHHDNENLEFHKKITIPVKNFDRASKISVCNGVLCFAKVDSTIILWNPAIGRMLTLPQPNSVRRGNTGLPIVGFGFDSRANDYKVLRINLHWEYENYEVFSLNRNSWRTISAPSYIFETDSLSIVNGALYWIAKKSGSGPKVILGFDINAELFREVPLPNSLDPSNVWFKIAVYKESFLALFSFNQDNDALTSIWAMNEYDNAESWTQIWKFNSMPPCTYKVWLRDNGQLLFYSNHPEEFPAIILVNPETEERDQLFTSKVDPFMFGNCSQSFEKSLVLLENANAITIEKGSVEHNYTDDDSDDETDNSYGSSDDESDDESGESVVFYVMILIVWITLFL